MLRQKRPFHKRPSHIPDSRVLVQLGRRKDAPPVKQRELDPPVLGYESMRQTPLGFRAKVGGPKARAVGYDSFDKGTAKG